MTKADSENRGKKEERIQKSLCTARGNNILKLKIFSITKQTSEVYVHNIFTIFFNNKL